MREHLAFSKYGPDATAARNDRGTIGRLDRADPHYDDGRTDRDVPRSDDGTLNVYTRADMVRDNARRGLGPLQISKGR